VQEKVTHDTAGTTSGHVVCCCFLHPACQLEVILGSHDNTCTLRTNLCLHSGRRVCRLCILRLFKRSPERFSLITMKYKRKATSGSVRLQIAWGQHWQCNACRQVLHWTFEVDHVVALCAGGSNESSNLQALCVKCHKMKSMRERGCAPETTRIKTHRACEKCAVVYSLYFAHRCP
jgi:hypothetical protein